MRSLSYPPAEEPTKVPSNPPVEDTPAIEPTEPTEETQPEKPTTLPSSEKVEEKPAGNPNTHVYTHACGRPLRLKLRELRWQPADAETTKHVK